MARDRRRHAQEQDTAQAAALPAAHPVGTRIPGDQNDAQRLELFHHFLRALAREAARRDHAADPD
ncbi:hypothetical protein [Sinirhodobacter huangdaonensis]|uniref:Uncharacterized protein n=1 Tax=Paenirhodobacter huangdaonensis TaxID=2501515 RepID=A0A3S4MCG3_9RHOB|nr:hypothetical protein [Sinirhodobacter huangdaonensis]RWR47700.1 hypothetical protein EOW66_19070 [Sinirhodobacter huangdaonensis]